MSYHEHMMRVSEDALDFALAHVQRYGDTDVLPTAFEFAAIESSWADRVRPFLAGQDLDTWPTGPLRRSLSPKGRIGYRVATQLDPLDTLLFTALVYEAGSAIEAARIPTRHDVVMSHRFKPESNGRLYAKQFSYDAFRRRSLKLATDNVDGWVVLTDIADFYPRLYSHRLENALKEAVPRKHARVISKLVSNWNQRVSYGIPVGPAASRLLAELCVADIDLLLRGYGAIYCRYSDDYRLFCDTEEEAFAHLGFLASALHKNHGLTLQEAKTEVLSARDFLRRFRQTDEQRERLVLEDNFLSIVDDLDIDSYGIIDYTSLTPEQQEAVDRLNLEAIVFDQITREQRIDIPLLGFVLRRMSQVGDISDDIVALILDNVDRVIPVFPDVIACLSQFRLADPVGSWILEDVVFDLLDHPRLSHLEYYRTWILTLFQTRPMSTSSRLYQVYNKHSDEFTRREAILTIGAAKDQAWVRMNKDQIANLGPWEKRALLRAASCLPKDEADNWFDFLAKSMQKLDLWVVQWAKKNRI